jgi:hypothetical protein
MDHLPLDAREVVDELRSAPEPPSGHQPRSWVPSASFEPLITDAERPPVVLNEHLQWLHKNWNLEPLLAPPPGGGPRGWVKRVIHRAFTAVLRPYLMRLQDCVGVTVRTLDTIARRVDDQSALQLRSIGTVRSDLLDLARHVDERLDE